jgi:hypothetical protein
MVAPGLCSPSRSVVSKMKTRSLLLSVVVLVISVFLSRGRGEPGAQTQTAGQSLVRLQSYAPDHPPAPDAGRRYSGADKKEKKQRGKQQQASRQQQTGRTGLLFRLGDGNGASALHWLGS